MAGAVSFVLVVAQIDGLRDIWSATRLKARVFRHIHKAKENIGYRRPFFQDRRWFFRDGINRFPAPKLLEYLRGFYMSERALRDAAGGAKT
jgi:hypothetical protein